MWNRFLLKSEAKNHLRKDYWMALAVSLILSAVTNGREGMNIQITHRFGSGSLDEHTIQYMPPEFWAGVAVGTAVLIIVWLIANVVRIFVGNPVEVGACRYFMENRLGSQRFNRLIFAFSGGTGQYGHVVWTLFIRDLKTALWTILFVIPGIAKSYEYRMVPYLLCERPDMPLKRAFELSRLMTQGEKWRIFVLDLSFLGWYLLGVLACCIGVVFVNPYYNATNAELYTALREKAFGLGYASHEELPGFQAAK